ncbi:MAG: TonB-dependent receptor [Methylococcaceae bacterium]|nr:MAG: TonB-dependent receptor [Methylococcaceae bacterium]
MPLKTQKKELIHALWLYCLLSSASSYAYDEAALEDELKYLRAEGYMRTEVFSASKKTQKLENVAAAIFVVSQDDIKRSGATHIADALRMVPGLDVGKTNSDQWAVSARGFSGIYATKLLVLVDGRSIYTDSNASVRWEDYDLPVDNIDRIEVIRGPGAALWGANAVNGVINIITKHSKDTQGGQLTLGGGSYDKKIGSFRYGLKLTDNLYGRIYAKGNERGDLPLLSNPDLKVGNWGNERAGVRLDYDKGNDHVMVQAEGFTVDYNRLISVPSLSPAATLIKPYNYGDTGAHALFNWKRNFSKTSDIETKAYYDTVEYNYGVLIQRQRTANIELKNHFAWSLHDFQWGLGYRHVHFDNNSPEPFASRYPGAIRETQLFSAFVQDELNFFDKQVQVTLGSKLEHFTYTGLQVQPNIRALWHINEKNTLWGAVSRAVRNPDYAEDDIIVHSTVLPTEQTGAPLPVVIGFLGDSDLKPEGLIAYELGYRWQAHKRFNIDSALFYHVYDNLLSFRLNDTPYLDTFNNTPFLFSPLKMSNAAKAEGYGFEIASNWQPFNDLSLHLAYTFQKMDSRSASSALSSIFLPAIERDNPQQQVSLRSKWNVTSNLNFDTWLRYVDTIHTYQPLQVLGIPEYVTLDLRLAWQPIKNLELAAVGQNLLDHQHPEFTSGALAGIEAQTQRSFYLQANWKF